MQTQKSIVLKRNMKKVLTSLLPMVKKKINNKINQIKSSIMRKIIPNKLKKKRITPKRISNRTLKSLENNSRVITSKNIINTPKIVINKPQIVTKPEVATMPKIVNKAKKVNKPKIVDKSEMVSNKKYKYKNRGIRQLKKLFDSKKKNYMDYDDEEHKGIRDLEYLMEEISEDNEDYYKPERVKNAFKNDTGDYNYIVYESRGSKYYESLEEYFSKIKPYLENMIRNYISIGEWKIQLAISTQFISSRNPEQFRIRQSNSENIQIMTGSDINDAVNNLLITLKENYINDLARMEGSEYNFERVVLVRYKLHKISLRRGGSYIDSPKWIKNKKGTINPKNEDDKCITYAIIASLNYDKIDSHPERISNLKPYINDYNWCGLQFPIQSSN